MKLFALTAAIVGSLAIGYLAGRQSVLGGVVRQLDKPTLGSLLDEHMKNVEAEAERKKATPTPKPPPPIPFGEAFILDGKVLRLVAVRSVPEEKSFGSGFWNAGKKDIDSNRNELVFSFEFENIHARKQAKLALDVWSASFRLTDDVGNVIERRYLGEKGHPGGKINPGDTVAFARAFDLPLDGTKHLILSVGAAMVGADRNIEFMIPINRIEAHQGVRQE